MIKYSNLVESELFGFSGYVFNDLEKVDKVAKYCFLDAKYDLKNKDNLPHYKIDENSKISLVRQVHGINIVECKYEGFEADGLILKPGDNAGIATADCTPLIIISKQNSKGLNLHCGWRSSIEGIVEAGFKLLNDNPKNLLALIGPAAQQCCYEVTSEFKDVISRSKLSLDQQSEVLEESKGKLFLSVPKYNYFTLLNLGFSKESIFISNTCTICDKRFHSYRRDGQNSGRQLTLLTMLHR